MTVWPSRRLPIRFDPVPGEGLDSWIEAYARRLRTCSSDLLNHIGLTGSTLTRMVTTLTNQERTPLSAATGITPQALTAMTLQPFDGVAVTIDPDRRVVVHPPAWRRQAGSRYCPECLRETGGRWQITWRLPWAFACPTHDRLLVDHCPGCGKRPAPHRPGTRSEATTAGHCTVNQPSRTGGWRAPVCGHPLTDVPAAVALPSGGGVLAAQRRILHLVAATVSTMDTARRARICQTLAEVHALAYKSLDALHTATASPPSLIQTVVDECGATVPAPRGPLDSYDAHTVAVATTLALAAHQPGHTGDGVLAWIIAADRQQRAPGEPGQILKPFRCATPALTGRVLRALDPHLQVHDRLVYSTAGQYPRRPALTTEQIQRRVASMPALIWPAWAIRLIPTSRLTDTAVTSIRAALAATVLIPGTRLTMRHAIDLLGGLVTPASVDTTLNRLSDQHRTTILAILTNLANALDAEPGPIDYTRRRTLFGRSTVDRHGYAKLAAANGWKPPSPLQLRLLDEHLTQALTGTPDHNAHPIGGHRRDVWNPLIHALPTAVWDFVRVQAHDLLHQHGIDEPLTWQPPVPTDVPWPGIDPDSINPTGFADAFTAHATGRYGRQLLRHATGLTGVQVRLYTLLVNQDMPEQRWNALAEYTDPDILAPVTLKHLYHGLRLSMMDIARLARTTEQAVRQALTTTGTTPDANRQRAKPVPATWYQQHYVGTGKTIGQAATEAGVSRNTFAKYARLHNIPTTENARTVNPFHGWPTKQRPPPRVAAALSSRHGIEYTRQVLAMLGHTTQRAAATTLGLHEQVLSRHRQHIEHAAGIRILQPSHPLTPTPAGARFLSQAALALRQLDLANSGRS